MFSNKRATTAADFYVDPRDLPGLDDDSTLALYSGLLPATTASSPTVNEGGSDPVLYFLLASSRHIARRPKLLVWFNGGPGCSSLDGLMEVGPFEFSEEGNLVEREDAWNEYSNILFVDQPAGTGFSYIDHNDNARELAVIADQVVAFMSNLYQIFPELQSMDLFLAGESYAGQYIPHIATHLLDDKQNKHSIRGLIIGNGWFSARDQYPAYLDYLIDEKLVKKGSAGAKTIKDAIEKCVEAMGQEGKGSIILPVCELILSAITEVTKKDGLCLNQYDTRYYHECGTEWPSGLKQLTPYLRRPEVIKALHVEDSPKEWSQCSNVVASHFSLSPGSLPSVDLLPSLLERVPILLYAGDKDMMCAHTGIEAMIANMTFNGAKGFNDTKGSSSWSVDGRQVGEWTTARNLTYVRFYNASHMVPLDELLASHDMILRFLAVDTLYAAGESASIPSNIGDETASVLNPVAPNGATLASSTKNATALDSESSETLDKLSGLDRSHEAYYGPRRSFGLFLLLTIVVLLIWSFLKWRTSRRKARNGRKSRYGRLNKNDGKRRSRKGVGRGGIRLTGGELERRSENGELKRNLSIVREVEEVEDEEEKEGKLYHEGKVLFELGEEEEDEDELLRESEEFDGDIGGTTSNPWKASI